MAYFELKNHEEVIEAIEAGYEIRTSQIYENSNHWLNILARWSEDGESVESVEVEVNGSYDEECALIKNGYYDLEINWDEGYLTVEIEEDDEYEDDWDDEDEEW